MTETTQIAEFNKTETALAVLREKFATVPDCKTKEGYEECRVGIRELVSLRTGLDKARLKLNEDDRARIQFRNDEAKRIQAQLTPLEQKLKDAKAEIDEAEERRKEEERAQEEKRVKDIEDAIDEITDGMNCHPGMDSKQIEAVREKTEMTGVDFDFMEFTEAATLERDRVLEHIQKVLVERLQYEEGQEALKAQQEEQAKQQAILDEQQRKQREDQERIEEDRREAARVMQEAREKAQKIEDDAAEKVRQEALEKARKEEEERRAKAQAEENKRKAEEADRLAKEEVARQEALRPEKDRLIDWAKKLRFIDGPGGIKDETLKDILSDALNDLNIVSTTTVKSVEDA